MDSTKEAEHQALTEAQALGKLVGFGLRVEAAEFRESLADHGVSWPASQTEEED